MFDVTSRFEERPGEVLAAPLQRGMLPPRDRDLQRANGAARIVFEVRDGRTYAAEVFQKSPIRVLFPRLDGNIAESAVLANTSGGIAGGDAYRVDLISAPGSSMAVTTQAAEKIYRALDSPALISTHLRVAQNARLAWLPQETILFDGARLHRSTSINAAPGAELLALEWTALGRAARGEKMREGDIRDSWRVCIGGRLVWADSFRIPSSAWASLDRSALLNGCTALATMIYIGPKSTNGLDSIREVLASLRQPCGVTQIGDVTILRFASREPSDLRLSLRAFLQNFSRDDCGSPFITPKMWSC